MDTPPFLNYLFQLNLFSSENSILSLQTFHVLNFPFYMMLGKYQQQNEFYIQLCGVSVQEVTGFIIWQLLQ